MNMGPGPRFEPESRDPQSRRITTYPTPAYELMNVSAMSASAGEGIRTLEGLCQQVLSLSPLAARAPLLCIILNLNHSKGSLNLENLKCSGRDSNPSHRLERPT